VSREPLRRAAAPESFDRADRALTLLTEASPARRHQHVVTAANADRLEEIVRYAEKRGCDEVELLRLKPAGRGRESWDEIADRASRTARSFRRSSRSESATATSRSGGLLVRAVRGVDRSRSGGASRFFSVSVRRRGLSRGIDAAGHANVLCSSTTRDVHSRERASSEMADAETFADYRGYTAAPRSRAPRFPPLHLPRRLSRGREIRHGKFSRAGPDAARPRVARPRFMNSRRTPCRTRD